MVWVLHSRNSTGANDFAKALNPEQSGIKNQPGKFNHVRQEQGSFIKEMTPQQKPNVSAVRPALTRVSICLHKDCDRLCPKRRL